MTTTTIDPARFVDRAVVRLSSIEFWERYSYFTMFALLALFVSAPVLDGGMGWSNGQALRFLGVYLFAVQTAPILGAYAADRLTTKRTALRLGALTLMLGHATLAAAAAIPVLVERWGGVPMRRLLATGGLALASPGARAVPDAISTPYHLVTLCFYAAVILVAVGNGLFKPILTVVIGRLPHPGEAGRNAAFTTFFLFINVGGLAAILLGGWLAQTWGWSFTFATSALGMLIAIGTTLALDRVYISPFLRETAPSAADAVVDAARPPPARAAVAMAVLLAVTAAGSVFSLQSYGFVTLFTQQSVRRDIGFMTIPASWFTALNPVTIMVLSPVLLAAWRRGAPGRDWTTIQRVAAGMIVMAGAFLSLASAAREAAVTGSASAWWVIGAISALAATELLSAPAGWAAVTRLAPPRLQTLAVAGIGAAAGVGAWFSGQVGAVAMEGNRALAMLALALATGLFAVVLLALRGQLKRVGL